MDTCTAVSCLSVQDIAGALESLEPHGTAVHSPAFLAVCVLAEHGKPLVVREAAESYVVTVLGTHVPPTVSRALSWRERVQGGDRAWRVRWRHARAAVRRLLPSLAGCCDLPEYDNADLDPDTVVTPPVGPLRREGATPPRALPSRLRHGSAAHLDERKRPQPTRRRRR